MSVIDKIQFIHGHNPSIQKNKQNRRLWICIHTMESPEGKNTAEDVARWLAAGRPGSPPGYASVHYCIDQNSIVQQAQTSWICAGAKGRLPNGVSINSCAVHIELAGRANQTEFQWADAASKATIDNCAQLCGRILVPKMFAQEEPSSPPPEFYVRHCAIGQIYAMNKGFISHNDATKACNVFGGHTDPGPNFPWFVFLQKVRSYYREQFGN